MVWRINLHWQDLVMGYFVLIWLWFIFTLGNNTIPISLPLMIWFGYCVYASVCYTPLYVIWRLRIFKKRKEGIMD